MILKHLALIATAGALAAAADYTIDSSHSSAQFAVRHLGVSNVKGQFSKIIGTVQFDAAKPAETKVNAVIDVATVDTRDEKRDGHLKGADFFDVAKFPTMTFTSTKAWMEGGTMKLAGNLTLHGVTKPVTLELSEKPAEVKDPWGMMRVGTTATTKINRKDFGVTWNKALDNGGVMISDEVAITIDLEGTRKAS
jgi:polyisoprenoid-binding protein YceI